MNRNLLLVTGVLALLCAGILILFTDIEVGFVRWMNCGPLAMGGEKRSEVCR